MTYRAGLRLGLASLLLTATVAAMISNHLSTVVFTATTSHGARSADGFLAGMLRIHRLLVERDAFVLTPLEENLFCAVVFKPMPRLEQIKIRQ